MNSRESGTSLLEVMIASVFLAVTMATLGLGVLNGIRSASVIKGKHVVQNQAFSYMERIQDLPFGTIDDVAASPTALDQLFDDTLSLPNLTLSQLRRAENADGLTFRIAGFEQDGTWEVRVNRDFDGDRVLDGEEDVPDLLRIEIFFAGRSILSTCRAQPAVAQ